MHAPGNMHRDTRHNPTNIHKKESRAQETREWGSAENGFADVWPFADSRQKQKGREQWYEPGWGRDPPELCLNLMPTQVSRR